LGDVAGRTGAGRFGEEGNKASGRDVEAETIKEKTYEWAAPSRR
jgi:hypothetical protein